MHVGLHLLVEQPIVSYLSERPQILSPSLSLRKPSHYSVCKGSYSVSG